ncbi:MAG: DNA-directed RNA polymerase subunit omega [Ignavibacteriales bacterium]|nr:DNA-directed RNA polymerase subunit omega [Ignavibacteriales bacterium]
MPIKPIDIEKISTVATNIYEAIGITAKRARQLHAESKIELNQQIETLNQLTNTVETEDEMDVIVNPDQLKISLDFEKRPKSTELALNDITDGKLTWRYKEIEAPADKSKDAE